MEDSVQIPVQIVFEDNKQNLLQLKQEIDSVIKDISKKYDALGQQVNPKGRSAQNKELQKQLRQMYEVYGEAQRLQQELDRQLGREYENGIKLVGNHDKLVQSIRTQAQLMRDVESQYKAINALASQRQSQIQEEKLATRVLLEDKDRQKALEEEIAELWRKGTTGQATPEEQERYQLLLQEKKELQEEVAISEQNVRETQAAVQATEAQLAKMEQEAEYTKRIASDEEAYNRYLQEQNEESNNIVEAVRNIGEQVKAQNEEADRILGIEKDTSDAIKDQNSGLKEQTKIRQQNTGEAERTNRATRATRAASRGNDNFGGSFMNRTAYYNLRQLRLWRSELDRINRNTDKVANGMKKMLTGAFKAIFTLASGFTNLRKATDKATKSNNKFGKSFSHNLWALLRYTLGIRSLFALTNRLRNALKVGIDNLVQYSDAVNGQMSSIATSMLYLKNSIAAGAQPFLNILAPAIDAITEKVSALTFNIAQLVASLTGQTYVYKAKKAQVDYAKSLSKTGEEAKKLKKELAEYDKLEVIKKDDDDNGMPNPSEMFETITPINSFITDIASKLKQIATDFFDPIKRAWDTKGKYVMDSWQRAVSSVWELIKTIGSDFLKVWKQDETVKMWETIFTIVGDIGVVVGNIATNLKDAWSNNDTGIRIFENLRDIAATFLEHVQNVTDYMKEWSEKLDFNPLLTSLADLFESLKKVSDFLGGIFEDVMERTVLKYIKWLIETGFPDLNKAISDFMNEFDWNGFRETLQPLWDAIEHLMEASFEGFTKSLGNLGDKLKDFTSSQDFKDFITNMANFLNQIDSDLVAKVFNAIYDALIKIASIFIRFINSALVQGFLQFLLDWIKDKSSEEIGDTLVAIAGGIAAFKFAEFGVGAFLNAQQFFTLLSSAKGAKNLAKSAKAIETASGTGVLSGLGKVLGKFVSILLLIADIKAAWELIDWQKNISGPAKALPSTSSFDNGVDGEVNGIKGFFIDIHDYLAEKFGGEVIGRYFHTPSDGEKLNLMLDDLGYIYDNLESVGGLTDDIKKKIESNWQMVEDNGGKVNGLLDEQVGLFDANYTAVKDYYEQLTRTKAPIGGVTELTENIGKIRASVPKETEGKEDGSEYADGWASCFESTSKFETGGQNLVQGTHDGVEKELAKDPPDKWYQKIWKSFVSLFKIGSPSKLFEQYGEWLIEGLSNGVTYKWTPFQTKMNTLLTGLKTSFTTKLDEIKNNASIKSQHITDAIVRNANSMSEQWAGAFNRLKTTTPQAFEQIWNGIKQPLNSIIGGVEQMVNSVISLLNRMGDAISEMSFDVPDWVPLIGGNTLNINLPRLSEVHIPRLAQGAVIPPNREFMAVLGDQKQGMNVETPLETMIEAFRQALREDGGSNQAPIVLQLDGKTIARVVWDETDKRYKQTGQYIPRYT